MKRSWTDDREWLEADATRDFTDDLAEQARQARDEACSKLNAGKIDEARTNAAEAVVLSNIANRLDELIERSKEQRRKEDDGND